MNKRRPSCIFLENPALRTFKRVSLVYAVSLFLHGKFTPRTKEYFTSSYFCRQRCKICTTAVFFTNQMIRNTDLNFEISYLLLPCLQASIVVLTDLLTGREISVCCKRLTSGWSCRWARLGTDAMIGVSVATFVDATGAGRRRTQRQRRRRRRRRQSIIFLFSLLASFLSDAWCGHSCHGRGFINITSTLVVLA